MGQDKNVDELKIFDLSYGEVILQSLIVAI